LTSPLETFLPKLIASESEEEMSENKRIYAGVDVGSLAAKSVIIRDGRPIGWGLVPSGIHSEENGLNALAEAVKNAGIKREDIFAIVATGYGRVSASYADKNVTEITCHAKGTNFLYPTARTIIDMGGQDCKAIRVSEDGSVSDFAMNDKCAAGTGRFLEVMASVFKVPLDRLGDLALQATDRIPMSSTCTVFVESETISLVARGEKPENILAGIHYAIAHRVAGLFSRVGIQTDVFFSGGVAKNTGMRKALEETMKVKIIEPTYDPQLTGALGAAVIAQTLGAKKEKAHELARA
jgi:predicted CoA-substrate-specific enzyme activase